MCPYQYLQCNYDKYSNHSFDLIVEYIVKNLNFKKEKHRMPYKSKKFGERKYARLL